MTLPDPPDPIIPEEETVWLAMFDRWYAEASDQLANDEARASVRWAVERRERN